MPYHISVPVSYTHLDVYKRQPPPVTDRWNCTDGQRGFILRIVSENASITKQVAEDLSQQLFGIGVKRRADVMAPVSYTHLDVYKRQEVVIFKKK